MTEKELKRHVQTAMTALEMACETLNHSNVDIPDPIEMYEFLDAKIHGKLLDYFLYKAEDKIKEGKTE